MDDPKTFTAFAGLRRLASGELAEVTRAIQADSHAAEAIIVFADDSGRTVDLDPRALAMDLATPRATHPADGKPARGRPKLGVTAREVTLLPRHWEWLATQPGGASAVLRRLVDQARRDSTAGSREREAREAAHRVMTTLAGDLPGYEEALRALYAGDRTAFARLLEAWPDDVRVYVQAVAHRAGPQDTLCETQGAS